MGSKRIFFFSLILIHLRVLFKTFTNCRFELQRLFSQNDAISHCFFCESAIHHIEGNLSIKLVISDFLFFICVFRLILPDRVTFDVYTTCVLQCSRYMAMLKKVFKNITVVLKKTIKLDVSHKTPDVFLCKHGY